MSSRISFSSRWAGALAALVCALLAAPAVASANSYNDAVKADGPLAYYELNETSGTTALDSSLNGVNGTYGGAFTLGVTGPFPGADTAVTFSDTGNVSASLTPNAHTAEVWVYPTGHAANMPFVTHGDPSADGWMIGIGPKHRLVLRTDSKTVNSQLRLPLKAWTMVDVVWGSGSVDFYLDGNSRHVTKLLPVATPGPSSNHTLTIGDGLLGGSFKGSVDEAALYPAALTPAQIGGHFAATSLPVNTAAPVVSGVPRVGQTLTATAGSWTTPEGTNLQDPTYQWQQCDADTGDCTDIASADSSTLTLKSAQLGSQIQVVVTESNENGASSALSNLTQPVVDLGPVNINAPTISGNTVEGQVLTADNGTWDDPGQTLSYSYQWQRCDVNGDNCVPVSGATQQTYPLTSADVGSTMVVTVTATDTASRHNSADSDSTAIVIGAQTGGSTGGGSSATGAAGGVLGSQVVCPARIAKLPKRVTKRHRGFGKVGLRFSRGSGNTALKAVLALRSKNVRSVEFRLGSKRVKRLRRSPFSVAVSRARLKPGATQTLTVIVTPRHGSKFRLKVRLHVAAC